MLKNNISKLDKHLNPQANQFFNKHLFAEECHIPS